MSAQMSELLLKKNCNTRYWHACDDRVPSIAEYQIRGRTEPSVGSALPTILHDFVFGERFKWQITPAKESSGLLRSDVKRPDGTTVVPWAAGKHIT